VFSTTKVVYSKRRSLLGAAGFVLIVGIAIVYPEPASAQELIYRPVNPSFGGNPFNTDYLMSTATAQRPERAAPPGSEPLTEGELFARQIQSRILSALSSSIVQAITGSEPGTSGEFTVGDQTIRFERTLTEIRLFITDNATGRVTTIVVPVLNLNPPAGSASAPPSAQVAGSTVELGPQPIATPTGAKPVSVFDELSGGM
jgi:curli production assembly/transport component CsgF